MASNNNQLRKKIPGTKSSPKNAQLLVSTGIPSLDNVIGGGLPIGSLLLIEEDTYNNYANVMFKYFLAEGAVSSHALFVASQDTKPKQLITKLPAVEKDTSTTPVKNSNYSNEKMEIAWRYHNMTINDSLIKSARTFGHFYDLTKDMNSDIIDNTDITYWDGDELKFNTSGFKNTSYIDLLKKIQLKLKQGGFYVTDNIGERNILRIGIQSLGSRLWLCDNEEDTQNDLLKFLYCFRSLLRSSYAVAAITVPVKNFDNINGIIGRMEHLSDTAIALESFIGSPKEANRNFCDYHGLLHVKKLSAINTLAAYCPETLDLAFKMRRKKFVIEVLHLPPELGEAHREQDDSSSIGCGSIGGGTSKLDF